MTDEFVDDLVMTLSEFKQMAFFLLLAGLLITASCHKKKFEYGTPREYTPQPTATPDNSSQVEPQKGIQQKGLNEKGEIDLLKIGHIHSMGRIQDEQWHPEHQEFVRAAVKQKGDAIPLLIEKIVDETPCAEQPFCYWNDGVIGDVAIGILSDLFSGSNISGTDWAGIIGYKDDSDEPFMNAWYDYVERHGRKPIKKHWQRIWTRYKDRIYWDEKELCFKVK